MKNELQRYSKGFYSVDALKRAIADYKTIALITMNEEDCYYLCSFSDCIVEPRRVMHEFNNYLIELMNTRGADAEG